MRTEGAIVDQHRERREQEMKIVTGAGAVHVVAATEAVGDVA